MARLRVTGTPRPRSWVIWNRTRVLLIQSQDGMPATLHPLIHRATGRNRTHINCVRSSCSTTELRGHDDQPTHDTVCTDRACLDVTPPCARVRGVEPGTPTEQRESGRQNTRYPDPRLIELRELESNQRTRESESRCDANNAPRNVGAQPIAAQGCSCEISWRRQGTDFHLRYCPVRVDRSCPGTRSGIRTHKPLLLRQ